jgi:hypothetical protein
MSKPISPDDIVVKAKKQVDVDERFIDAINLLLQEKAEAGSPLVLTEQEIVSKTMYVVGLTRCLGFDEATIYKNGWLDQIAPIYREQGWSIVRTSPRTWCFER